MATKFGMGAMPVTSTGLVPSSYRRAIDKCQEWSPLPKQPRPELYPYRGDYVNARNRKLQARKAAKKPPKKLSVPSRPKQLKSEPEKEVDFDTYTQHVSTTQLSVSEQEAKAKNKERFLEYMRSEARKRERRMALEKKLKSELKHGDDGNLDAQISESKNEPQKKPAVPRLSYMARTGKKTKSELARLRAIKSEKENKPSERKKAVNHEPKRKSYLEFISRKADELSISQNTTAISPVEPETRHKKIISPTQFDTTATHQNNGSKTYGIGSNSDEDGIRSRIEDIVHKAAAMVINDNKINTSDSHKNATELNTTSFSWLVDSISSSHEHESKSICQVSKEDTTSKCDTQSELSDVHRRLQELEERIRCLSPSSSIMRDIGEEPPSTSLDQVICANELSSIDFQLQPDSNTLISEVTYQGRQVNSKQNQSGFEPFEDYSRDSSTEVVPRPHVQPTHFQPNRRSSNHDNSINDTIFGSLTQTDGPGLTALNERCPLPQHTSEELPSTTSVQPSIKPVQTVNWEEEPLPRGYESTKQSLIKYQVADDILSLL